MSKNAFQLRVGWAMLAIALFALVVSMSSLDGVAASKKAAAAKEPTATPSPTPTPSPPPIPFLLQNKKKIIFVLATGGDDQKTSKMLLAGFTQAMQARVPETVVLISQPDWTTANIVKQCTPKQPSRVERNVPEQNVQGYMIIRLLATTSWVSHRILKEVPTSAIDADALYAECQPSLPEHVAYTWHENALYELGTRKILNLSAFSLVFPLIALYEAVVPSKTSTTVTTRTFPTPPGGGVSQVVGTNSSVTNSNQGSTNSLTAAILTGAVDYSTKVAQAIKPGDAETWDVVNLVSENIANRACPPKATGTPAPTSSNAVPFCIP